MSKRIVCLCFSVYVRDPQGARQLDVWFSSARKARAYARQYLLDHPSPSYARVVVYDPTPEILGFYRQVGRLEAQQRDVGAAEGYRRFQV